MDAIETLMNEHRVIERVLDALVAFADEAQRKGATEKEELSRFVTFVREFADAAHHGKEEDVLFRAMVDHGFPRNGGPIAVMLHEHDAGRALVAALAEYAAKPGDWTAADLAAVGDAAHGFATLLRAHIHKEDAVLYPMAEGHLPADAMERVADACEALDASADADGTSGRLHALADALVLRWARATHPPVPAPQRFCC